jgi:hypothetical protein
MADWILQRVNVVKPTFVVDWGYMFSNGNATIAPEMDCSMFMVEVPPV